jgi:2-polyprenyl-3-methyl-5-hydroxy-6-metoxy-1,4-benzoquinol methylase
VSQENVVGNFYDKYATKNRISRALVGGFLSSVTTLYRSAGAKSVLEVGCGEGKLADHLVRSAPRPERFLATDLSLERQAPDIDPMIEFAEASVYDLPFETGSFDLVLCCEVLEHLERPREALDEVARVARNFVLISTPWEPVWRAMNMVRGKYLRDLGNTPGHIQHFGRGDLLELASTRLEVVSVRRPLPWTVILGEPRVSTLAAWAAHRTLV